MTDDVRGLTAVVTGGGAGIGLATALALSQAGANVAALDISLSSVSAPILGVPCDVSDDASTERAVAAVIERFGGIDILVNNAGIGASGDIAGNELDEWRHVFEINVLGVVRMSRAALPWLRRSPHPAIVNMCSVAATAGLQQRAAYSASKGAVLSLTLAMAADHVREGIRVNAVNPGTVDTPWVGRLLASATDPGAERQALEARQPHGRLVTADEVAAAICFLAGRSAASVTGATLAVDGGMQGLRLRPASQ